MGNTSMQYWEQKITEWRISGLDIREWCQKDQIDLKQFYIWKNKLKNIKTESEEPVFIGKRFKRRRSAIYLLS